MMENLSQDSRQPFDRRISILLRLMDKSVLGGMVRDEAIVCETLQFSLQ